MILLKRDEFSKTTVIAVGGTMWRFPVNRELFLVDENDLPLIMKTGAFNIVEQKPELIQSAYLITKRLAKAKHG